MQYKKSVFRSLAMVTQLGLSVITPIFLCIFTGYYIDLYFGTKLIIPLLILGTLSGGRCAYVLAKKTLEAEKREDEKEALRRREEKDSTIVHKPKTKSRVYSANTYGDEESTDREALDDTGNKTSDS